MGAGASAVPDAGGIVGILLDGGEITSILNEMKDTMESDLNDAKAKDDTNPADSEAVVSSFFCRTTHCTRSNQ